MESSDLSALKIDRSTQTLKKTKLSPVVKYGLIGVVAVIALFKIISLFFAPVQVKATTATVSASMAPSSGLTASGYIIPQRKASVASKATGRLVYLSVVEGDQVKKGDLIGKIEDNDIMAEWLDANSAVAALEAVQKRNQAELNRLQTDYNRLQNLHQSGAVSKSDLDNAQTNYQVALAQTDVDIANIKSARARMQAVQVRLDNTEIRAPFNGTILTKGADIGEIVAPFAGSVNAKSAVVTMADMTSLQLEADVSESSIQKVSIGQNCEIILDAYPQTRYPGVVDKIVPTANRSKATILCKIKFLDIDEKVLPEMSAKATFLSEPISGKLQTQKPNLLIETRAILTKENTSLVYVIVESKLEEREISTGKKIGDDTVVLSGLKSGDQVVLDPTESLSDGQKVELIQ
jgi:RND family efflux transporter MFP subunit